MVIGHDFLEKKDFKKPSKQQEDQKVFIAPATDRLAAFILDLMILFPVIKIFCSQMVVALKITFTFQLFFGFAAAVFVMLWTALAIYLAYQLTAQVVFRRTIGQYLFKIQLLDSKTLTRPDSYKLILRTLLSFFTVFVGVPLVAVLTDEKGRTFYDKVSDTIMVSKKPQGILSRPTANLHTLAGSVLVFNLLVLTCAVSLFLSKNFYKFKSDLGRTDQLCEQVTNEFDSWWGSGVHESRIEVALALFSATQITPECLKKEIAFELSLNNKNPVAYLANGFLKAASDEVLAMEYFKKSCDLDVHSHACELVLWINSWPESYEGEAKRQIDSLPLYMQVWSLKRDLAKGNMYKLTEDLNQFKVRSGIENFFAEMQFKVSSYLKRPEESKSMLKALSAGHSDTKSLNERVCSSMLSEGCQAFKSSSCQQIQIQESQNEHVKNAYYACHDQNHNIFTKDLNLKKFYNSFKDDKIIDLEVIKSIIKNNKHPIDVRMAALNKGFSIIQSADYLKELTDEWNEVSHRDYVWRLWGEKMMRRFSEVGDGTHSFIVYKSLNKEYNDEEKTADRLMKSRELTKNKASDLGLRFPATLQEQKGQQ